QHLGCRIWSKGYRQGYPFAHYSAASLPSSCWLFSASSPSSTVSIIPRPTATYLIIFNAFPGNLIGANSTNCTAWLIFLFTFFITYFLSSFCPIYCGIRGIDSPRDRIYHLPICHHRHQ